MRRAEMVRNIYIYIYICGETDSSAPRDGGPVPYGERRDGSPVPYGEQRDGCGLRKGAAA